MQFIPRVATVAVLVVCSFSATALAQFTDRNAISSKGSASTIRAKAFEELAADAEWFERQGKLLRRLIELVRPSVVHIEAQKQEPRSVGFRRVEETGSGIILKIDQQWCVLTNLHVIRDVQSPADIDIRLSDGRQTNPIKVMSDPGTDIAVLMLRGMNMVPARIGNSENVAIGDFALAYGSPFGLSHSATLGIISAKGRRDLDIDDGDELIQDFLQTDAAINPGNSGGPLINVRGEVIGLNTAIASSSGGNEGIGFSIPINMAMFVARQLISSGKVTYAYLGVTLDSKFSATVASKNGLPKGALVKDVYSGTPAANAKIAPGDVIVRVSGVRVEDDTHLVNLVKLSAVGQTLPVELVREGKALTVQVEVADRREFDRK